ncbi:MAG: FAD-dependent monooxygenase [Gammaproteobacteria bacterium]
MACKIVISGGGTIGASLALILTRTLPQIEVHLVEPRPADAQGDFSFFVKGGGRALALSQRSTDILKEAGVWQSVHKICVKRMEVLDALSNGQIHWPQLFPFNSPATLDNKPLAWIVSEDQLRSVLWSALRNSDHPGLVLHENQTLVGFSQTSQLVKCQLSSDETLMAHLAIGADGTHSPLRSLAQIPVTERITGQSVLVASIQTSRSHDNTAKQIFTPSGPIGLLPLTIDGDDHWYHMIWSAPSDQINALAGLGFQDFARAFAHAADGIVGDCLWTSNAKKIPINIRTSETICASGLALVGDAAQNLHPLMGQGFNLALADVLCLCHMLRAELSQQPPASIQPALQRYQRHRAFEHCLWSQTAHALLSLFTDRKPAPSLYTWASGVAMNAALSVPGVTNLLQDFAAGDVRLWQRSSDTDSG